MNSLEGEPAELAHPRSIEKYSNTGTYTGSATEYADYRTYLLEPLS